MKIAQPVIAVFVVAALAGCATPSTVPNGSGSATATSTPSPSASGNRLPADALFRITTVITSKTSGATARLVETVFAPTSGDGTEASQMSAAQCADTGWTTKYPTPKWLSVTVASTLLSGTSWPKDLVGVQSTGLNAFPAWSGAVGPFQAYCASGLVTIPGDGHAVIPVDPSVAVDDPHSWGSWRYGFDWAADGGLGAADQPSTFTSCTLERGSGAAASATVSDWDANHPVDPGDGFSPECYWGSLT